MLLNPLVLEFNLFNGHKGCSFRVVDDLGFVIQLGRSCMFRFYHLDSRFGLYDLGFTISSCWARGSAQRIYIVKQKTIRDTVL